MKKVVIRFLILAVIVVVLFNIYNLARPVASTEMVKFGVMENSGVYNGIVIRDETLIESGISGVLESYVSEGEVVKKNKNVAVIYKGNIDSETQAKLKQINERIAEITSTQESIDSFSYDKYKIEGDISNKINDLIGYTGLRDATKVIDIRDDINKLIDKKVASVSGSDGMGTSTILNELKKEKEEYESKLSASKEELFSPRSGIYSTSIDGYEDIVKQDAIGSMTVDSFNEIQNKDITKDDIKGLHSMCKIVSNIGWSVAMKVESTVADDLKAGDIVYIKISDDSSVTATIDYISTDTGKEKVVIASSSEYNEEVINTRKIKVTLTTAKYSGLKVPMEAVRVKDGVTGVYTVTNGLMKFKKVEVLYNDGKSAIVKEDSSASGTLLLYDEVIISAKKVEEGMLVR